MNLGLIANKFSGNDQQDAQELLQYLLDGMHEELNRVIRKPDNKLIRIESCDS